MSFDNDARMTKRSIREGHAAAQQPRSQIEQSLTGSADHFREFQLNMLETLRVHSDCMFDLARQLVTAGSLMELSGIWRNFAEQQIKLFQKRTGEFAPLSQEVAKKQWSRPRPQLL